VLRGDLPRIADVSGKAPLTLRVIWRTDAVSVIDVSGLVRSLAAYAPLRTDPALFGSVRVGEYGTDIVWNDSLDMSADTLWRLAQEQSGEALTPEQCHDDAA
jgi:hypothetical protein